MNLDVRSGVFPQLALPKCNLFLALDVLEHSHDPETFMKGVAQLLTPKGIAIVQTPINHNGYEPPFGEIFNKVFDDLEHLWVFTPESIDALGRSSGLIPIAEDQWELGHETVTFQKA